jgi:PEP-CTERM motif
VAHEIGHTLGLVHTDAAAMYAAAANDAAGKTAVQNNDLMRANVTSFNSAISTTTAFNAYSRIKLGVAANGILLENQAADSAQGHPGTADPIGDSGDTNTSFVSARPLITNGQGMVDVIGHIDESVNRAAIDYFKFNGRAGQVVDLEIYSLGLEQIEGDTNSGRIPTGDAIGTSQLSLLTAGNGLLTTSPFPATTDATGTNYDGAISKGNPVPNAYGDPLIYGYTLPAAGTYFVELQGSQSGFYELFAVVPEPSSCALLVIGFAGCGGLAWRRKRQRS